MQYEIGKPGRTIVVRGFDGENVYEGVEAIARKENIRCANVWMVGGLRKAKVVVGPKNPNGPIEPMFEEFDDAREIAGVGTIFWDEEGPKMHLHTAIGRGKEVLVGCPRGGAGVFCVLEIILQEIEGVNASRVADPSAGGLKLLTLANPKTL